MKKHLPGWIALLTVFAQVGCSDSLETVVLTINEEELTAEVARTAEEQARGLMFRESMPEDHGMLFPYEYDRQLRFWMKDTLIPLSIAYISAAGVIKEIYDMKPESLREVPSRQSVRYALEVNQGYFQRHGIEPGDTVVFPADFSVR